MVDLTAQARVHDLQVQVRMRGVMPHKDVMVSRAEQTLRALRTRTSSRPPSAGRAALPTVTGHFAIYAKVTPWEFISPWPAGSPYYNPLTQIRYWSPSAPGTACTTSGGASTTSRAPRCTSMDRTPVSRRARTAA
jgi:hypothetical protein